MIDLEPCLAVFASRLVAVGQEDGGALSFEEACARCDECQRRYNEDVKAVRDGRWEEHRA